MQVGSTQSFKPLALFNGEILPLSDVRVSPLDRGYHFGDGIYEVFRVQRGHLFSEAAHWRRFERSLKEMKLPSPDLSTLKAQCHELVKLHPYTNATLYVQVTRGVATKREHGLPSDVMPTILVVVNELPVLLPTVKTEGCRVITHPDLRWKRCDIKSLNLLGNIMGAQAAKEADCYESIFINDLGELTEGSRSNFFAVLNGEIRTMPTTGNILPGITRNVVVSLAKEHGLAIKEAPLLKSELAGISEAFVTNTSADIYPIVGIDGRVIGSGKPGPIVTKLMQLFEGYLAADIKAGIPVRTSPSVSTPDISSFQPSCG